MQAARDGRPRTRPERAREKEIPRLRIVWLLGAILPCSALNEVDGEKSEAIKPRLTTAALNSSREKKKFKKRFLGIT